MSKKAAKPIKEPSSYETRDIVLGKVRGYPPWPGMVVDPDTVPSSVSKERPSTKKTTFYCVRFFPTGDYAWLVAKDISKLQPHEIQSYINEPYKKSGDLLQGYRIALDPRKWEEEREAESRLAAEEEANAEVDQLESENEASGEEDEEEPKSKAKARKRKRESDASAVKPKKSSKPRKDSAESTKRKTVSAASKGKKNGKKSNALVESEDEGDDASATATGKDTGTSKRTSPPPTKKIKREKEEDGEDGKASNDPEAIKVRDWRHKLQKTFLSHKSPPKEEDMPSIDNLFTTVENYENITIEYLQFSKIGKVMRHIAILPDDKVPRNAEFKFRERADALVKKWHQVLNANKSNGPESISAIATVMTPVSTVAQKSSGADKEKEESVTEGTAAISLNGKSAEENPSPLQTDKPAEENASSSVDVTMADVA